MKNQSWLNVGHQRGAIMKSEAEGVYLGVKTSKVGEENSLRKKSTIFVAQYTAGKNLDGKLPIASHFYFINAT